MAELIRHAEAARAAEAVAGQAEAWADAAEGWAEGDVTSGDALFAMRGPDVRQVASSRAHHGVADRVAEAWQAEVEAQGAPVPVGVRPGAAEAAEEERAEAARKAAAERRVEDGPECRGSRSGVPGTRTARRAGAGGCRVGRLRATVLGALPG